MKTEAGFTLLEVMIALSIISLVLVGVFQLQSRNIALGSYARFNAVAPVLARQIAAEILADPEDFSMSGSGDFGETFPEYRWYTEMEDIGTEYLGETAKRMKRIDIFIDAEDYGSQYHLRTYYFFDEEQ